MKGQVEYERLIDEWFDELPCNSIYTDEEVATIDENDIKELKIKLFGDSSLLGTKREKTK